jgi:AmiR/NasT family two-component response regulator
MTAYDSPDVQDETAQLGVDGYLKKPFSTAKLRDMATEILISTDSYSATQKLENLLTD